MSRHQGIRKKSWANEKLRGLFIPLPSHPVVSRIMTDVLVNRCGEPLEALMPTNERKKEETRREIREHLCQPRSMLRPQNCEGWLWCSVHAIRSRERSQIKAAARICVIFPLEPRNIAKSFKPSSPIALPARILLFRGNRLVAEVHTRVVHLTKLTL